jgi:hypothetical protein
MGASSSTGMPEPSFNPSAVMLARIRTLQNATPFVPFVTTVSDGRSYEVPSPDDGTITRLRKEIILEFDDRSILDLNPLPVTGVERKPPTAA